MQTSFEKIDDEEKFERAVLEASKIVRNVFGWSPTTDEDEDDPRYDTYWDHISLVTNSLLTFK